MRVMRTSFNFHPQRNIKYYTNLPSPSLPPENSTNCFLLPMPINLNHKKFETLADITPSKTVVTDFTNPYLSHKLKDKINLEEIKRDNLTSIKKPFKRNKDIMRNFSTGQKHTFSSTFREAFKTKTENEIKDENLEEEKLLIDISHNNILITERDEENKKEKEIKTSKKNKKNFKTKDDFILQGLITNQPKPKIDFVKYYKDLYGAKREKYLLKREESHKKITGQINTMDITTKNIKFITELLLPSVRNASIMKGKLEIQKIRDKILKIKMRKEEKRGDISNQVYIQPTLGNPIERTQQRNDFINKRNNNFKALLKYYNTFSNQKSVNNRLLNNFS